MYSILPEDESSVSKHVEYIKKLTLIHKMYILSVNIVQLYCTALC